MKKSFQVVFLIVWLFLIVSNADASTQKIYPTDDAMAQLFDVDNISNWAQARNFQGQISLQPTTEIADGPGKLAIRSDNGAGTYRIYRVSNVFNLQTIPLNATITGAKLQLYKTPGNNAGDISVVITSHERENISLYAKR